MLLIVLHACRYAYGAIAEWQVRQGVTRQGMIGTRTLKETAKLRMRRAHSKALRLIFFSSYSTTRSCCALGEASYPSAGIPCMTQLQMKHSDAMGEANDTGDVPERSPSRYWFPYHFILAADKKLAQLYAMAPGGARRPK